MNAIDILKLQTEACFQQNFTSDDNPLRILDNHIDFKFFLQQISKDRKSLKILKKNSYRHPLGFKKYTLFHSEQLKGTFRLHVWNQPFHHYHVEDAHSHRWDFYSLILNGNLEFEEYKLDLVGEEVDYYTCPKNKNGQYIFNYIEKQKIRITKKHYVSQGQSYFFNNQQIHKITKVTPHTKSLVLELDTELETSNVYRKNELHSNTKSINTSKIHIKEIMSDFSFLNKG